MKIKITKIILLIIVLVFNIKLIHCQIITNKKPFSSTLTTSNSFKYPQIMSIAPPDMKKIIAEDSINDKIPGTFKRVAVPIPVCINSDNEQTIGAITSKFLKGNNERPADFSTGIILGDEITLEYYQPSPAKEKPIISISNVYYGYRHIRKYDEKTKNFGDSGNCQVNINCTEGQNWQNEKKAIARVYVKTPTGAGWCSGSLLNNTCNNFEPLFLTANHCLDNYFDAISNSSISQWIFYWDYEFPQCEDLSNEPTIKSTVGATVIANNSVSDFALLELNQDPRDLTNFRPYYLGWDHSGNAGTGGVGIHHPQGDVKKIATYNISPNNSNCFSSGNINFWEINWQSTTHGWSVTEGGSSGSPLINSSSKVIGQLYGSALCSNPNCSNPSQDIGNYGKFSISWTGNGALDNRRRLDDWLDPIGTAQTTLSGLKTPFITGPSQICTSGTYTINNLPPGATVQWIGSKALEIVSGQGTSSVVCEKTMFAISGKTVTLRAGITICEGDSSEITKEILIGTPAPTILLCTVNNNYPGSVGPAVDFGFAGEDYWLYAYGADLSGNDADYLWRFYPSDPLQLPVQGTGRQIEFSKDTPGNYTVSLQYNGVCGWSREVFKIIRIEQNIESNIYLSFSPNPTTGETTLTIESGTESETLNSASVGEDTFDYNAE